MTDHLAEIASFLATYHGSEIENLEALSGGFWSSAYGYRANGQALVLRLGKMGDGFKMDQAAFAFSSPDLPIPEVYEVGKFDVAMTSDEAPSTWFAISERRFGSFLEDVTPEQADTVGPAVESLLAGLAAVPSDPAGPMSWFVGGSQPNATTWSDYLRRLLVDDPSNVASGWRRTLAADPDLDQLFTDCERRIDELLAICPERRDLIHGDLLHQNVLISADAAEVTAVFSWKCSTLGDFLYEVAWFTFWSPWHPGIEALDLWNRVQRSPAYSASDLADAAQRHHCYELHIGAQHLGWCAWTGNNEELSAVADHTRHVLQRGPLAIPS